MSLSFDLISSEFNFSVASNSDRVVYLFDEYRLDKSRRMLYRGAQEVVLPPKAVETLIALIEKQGEIVGKDDLMKIIWADTIVEESNLAHHLHVLRKALGLKSDGQTYIETFRRRGYRFNSEARVVADAGGPKLNGHNAAPPEPVPYPFLAGERPDDPPPYAFASISPLQSHISSRHWPLIATAGLLAVLLGTVLYFQWQRIASVRPATARGDMSVTPLTNGNALLDATISPDGKYFIYHEVDEDKAHLWVQQTGQAGRVEIIPAGDRSLGGKTFSPNSEFVYFVSREKGEVNSSVYRVPTFGGPLTKILDQVDSPVSFSPDGSQMVFVRRNDTNKQFHLVVAAADGGEERVLLTRSGSNQLSMGHTWSADGKFIAFGAINAGSSNGEGTCSIAAINLRSGIIKDLSAERWDTCYRMARTPDGAGIIFIGTRVAESYTIRRDQIYYLSVADGQSRRLSTDGSRYQAASLGITADNSLLAVPHTALSQIWVMNAQGDVRTATQLTNGQSDGRAGIAPLPDGRIGYISRVGENLSIWIMNGDGSGQRQISDQLPFVEELGATPDGRFFIFSARRDGFSHLYRIDLDGQNLTPLTGGESYEIDSTVSPDSRWVYYGSNIFNGHRWKTQLRKTSIDTAETIELKELETVNLVPNLSPDGKLIAGATEGGLKIFSSHDGTQLDSLETDKLADFSTGAKWTPDGRSLAYLVHRQNSSNLWVQPVGKRVRRPLTAFPKGYIYRHAFSHDGTRLYVARGHQIRDAVLIKNF
jgi:Tol biopolymer transport system component/DNA-binding winged helix-turn-helix (wHTH) protein